MTNHQIIAKTKCELAAFGRICTTEKDGFTVPAEDIYTKNVWKKRGYHVRESEEPIAVVPIWVFCKGSEGKAKMCRVRAHFYKASQVIKI